MGLLDKLFGKKKDNSSAETAIPEAELERYQGSDTEVQVPDCVDGYKVVRIGDYCFARCSFITSVALPDTVKKI